MRNTKLDQSNEQHYWFQGYTRGEWKSSSFQKCRLINRPLIIFTTSFTLIYKCKFVWFLAPHYSVLLNKKGIIGRKKVNISKFENPQSFSLHIAILIYYWLFEKLIFWSNIHYIIAHFFCIFSTFWFSRFSEPWLGRYFAKTKWKIPL